MQSRSDTLFCLETAIENLWIYDICDLFIFFHTFDKQ